MCFFVFFVVFLVGFSWLTTSVYVTHLVDRPKSALCDGAFVSAKEAPLDI